MNDNPENPALPSRNQQTLAADTDLREVPLLIEYLQVAINRKWAILGILLATLLGAMIITWMSTPMFTAKSRIEISRTGDRITKEEGIEAKQPQDFEFYQTQYSLLEARSLAERVVRAENLAADNAFFATFGGKASAADGQNAGGSAELNNRVKRATNILLRNVKISPIRASRLVDVSFTSPDPALSTRIANAWVQQFIGSALDRRFASTADARKFLEERLDELRKKLNDSESALVTYAANKQIVTIQTSTDSEGRTNTQRTLASNELEALNEALTAATVARIQAESELRQSGASTGQVTNTTLGGMRARRAEVAAELAKQSVQFGDAYPTVVALRGQVGALDRAISNEEGRINSSVRNNYRQAVQRESELQSRLGGAKGQVQQQQRDSIQYNIYQREVDTNRQLYEGLLQRYKEIGVAAVGANNIAVVDRAEKPTAPSSPNMRVNLLLGLLLGIAFVIAYLFAAEQVDQSLKDPSDVKRLLRLPLIGTIPVVEDDSPEAYFDRKSESFEAYLAVQANLSFITDHGMPRSFMLTSTRPNEGKTRSVLTIASILADAGKKVVVIDGDMRNPSVHKRFDMKNDVGLSNYLSGGDDVRGLIKGNDKVRFNLIVGGPTPPNAAELLTSDRMAQLVQKLLETFDHVIVDAPPVLGLADVPLLTRAVEGVVFAIEANGPKIRPIQSALDRIRVADGRLFGVIVTKLDGRNSAYGYGYGYGYSYAYRYGHDNRNS